MPVPPVKTKGTHTPPQEETNNKQEEQPASVVAASNVPLLVLHNMPNLDYPNLAPCRVVVNGSGGSSKPPVRLPAACLAAAAEPELAAAYDFSLGTHKKNTNQHEKWFQL